LLRRARAHGSIVGLALAACLGSFAASARAQVTREPVSPYPDPKHFARGAFGEAEAGALVFLGSGNRDLGPGAVIGVRVGYEIIRFVAIQIHGLGSTHETRFPGRPQAGQLVQLFQASAELKLQVRIRQLGIAAMGGAGYARLSTNLLGTTGLTDPDQRTSQVLLAGGGLDYHTLSRHFSFGVTGLWARYAAIAVPGAITATAYARYTF
jgi:hypothetical protein